MFAKTLALAALVATTSEARNLGIKKELHKIRDLIDVDIKSLTKEELEELIRETIENYEEYCIEQGKSYLTKSDKRNHQVFWLQTEADIQTLNKDSRSTWWAHNRFSDLTPDEKQLYQGVKLPKNFNKEGTRLRQNRSSSHHDWYHWIDISFDMTQAEYQDVYDASYDLVDEWMDCATFDVYFNLYDDVYMSGQRKIQYREEVKKNKSMTASEFETYWQDIESDRQAIRDAITRCDGRENDGSDEGGDDQRDGGDTVGTCSTDLQSFQWDDTKVAPIKDQGGCGSVYAFSAVAVLETAFAISRDENVRSYSEQQIVDCKDHYQSCYGCQGGWPAHLFESTQLHPIVPDEVYPYTGVEGICQAISSELSVSASTIFFADPNNVKEHLCNGALSVTIKADTPLRNYAGGVLTSASCPYNQDPNHAATVIGWTVVDGVEAYVVRNSWGAEWGVNGYAYLAMDAGNDGYGPCGINQFMTGITV